MTPYYEEAGITIYHGDCHDYKEMTLDSDCIVTDPPYGVGYASHWENKFQGVRIAGDETTDSRDNVLHPRGNRPAIVFGSWKCAKPLDTKSVLIWDKGTVGMGDLSMPWFPCTEEIYIVGRGWVGSRTTAVLRYVQKNDLHPTEKPLSLLLNLISKCDPDWSICDPFMGSGSTLAACKELGRKATGIELEERYCEIAANRLRQSVLNFETEVA